MDNFRNVCLKVKKQQNIPPLVTVIQVSYIMLTEGQEYNFHGMKCNILKNNMHWVVSQEKENICNLFFKISRWIKVPRRVLWRRAVRRVLPDAAVRRPIRNALGCPRLLCIFWEVFPEALGEGLSPLHCLPIKLALLHFHYSVQSL